MQAYLTGAGREAVLFEGYTVPDVRAKERSGCAIWLRFVASHEEESRDFMSRHALAAEAPPYSVLMAAADEIEHLGERAAREAVNACGKPLPGREGRRDG
jgi:hypothetical protein